MEPKDIQKTIRYWLESAEYDLETAKSLISSKRFPHALFFGYLAIEKILKAIYVKRNKEHAPYLHSLKKLAQGSNFELSQEIVHKLADITRYNIEARYPDFKASLYKIANKSYADKKFNEILEVYEWFRQRL